MANQTAGDGSGLAVHEYTSPPADYQPSGGHFASMPTHTHFMEGMMNEVQQYQPQQYPVPPRRRPGAFQVILMILAGLYWLSPIDLIPFVPIDDLLVLGTAIYFAWGGE